MAAYLEGFDMSGLLRNFMIRTAREVRARDPEAFDAALEKERAKNRAGEAKSTPVAELDTTLNKNDPSKNPTKKSA